VKFIIAQSALKDLQDIKIYYKDQGVPEIGLDFIEAILAHAQSLLRHPDSGRMVPELEQEHIREIIHPPFRVVYLRHAQTINLVRVWRSERLLLLSEDET
jgi:toxin ParE1/3/4